MAQSTEMVMKRSLKGYSNNISRARVSIEINHLHIYPLMIS